MYKKKVAVYPAGTEVGLEIHNALRFAKDIELIGLASLEDHSSFVYKTIDTNAPYIDDDNLFTYLEAMIEKYNIEYIFPAHDEAVLLLTKMESLLNIKVIAPCDETAEICRYKSKTYDALKKYHFIPKTFQVGMLDNNSFPLFIKPDKGQGSNGAIKIESMEQILKVKELEKNIICEYLPGEEYTIACLSDHDCNLLYAGQRTRSRVKMGISVSSVDVPISDEVESIANKISTTLKMTGAWFFQVKKDKNGQYKLLEVAARIAGSMGLHRNQGINFPLLSLYIKDKMNVKIIKNDISFKLDRALISRYKQNLKYTHVYIDFDDTILLNGKVNPFIMHYLYQCQNKGIKLYLITRHDGIVEDTLKQLCIDKNIFEKIIHIADKERKSHFINHKEAIFIDDAFSERLDVHNVCHIPVFDLDSIEFLIDWRV